jgi:uncharacterized Ntn-hydrolase superfamily protein
MRSRAGLALAGLLLFPPCPATAQEPVRWGEPLNFATFSIAAVDPATGETGVAVTTRNPCVGNAVPHVRAGVGAVATQAFARVEYGPDLLDALEAGHSPADALRAALAADSMADRRQVGVIALDAASAQHTGSGASAWAGHLAGATFVTQGNLLVGREVIEAVARTFEASEGSSRHLADRLIEAMAAGQAEGGDARKGRLQSAAVLVADPRPGRSRRPDRVTVNINVCEHAEPVAEMRRIHDTISETLGYRTLEQFTGNDIVQLKLLLHAAGYYRSDESELREDAMARRYTADAIAAVDSFRAAVGLSGPGDGSPAGLVDEETIRRLWAVVERAGRADGVRARIRALTEIRR